MEGKDPVVFAAGVYEVECPHGSATVHVPRDIGLAEVSEALAPLMERRAVLEEHTERKAA